MLPAAIPYAFEKKAVDAVVVDALRGFTMDGEKIPASTAAGGHVTYVLVVNKSFKSEPRYQQFIDLFKAAVEELNDPAVLKECIPGCEDLTADGENAFAATVVLKIGPIKARPGGRVQWLQSCFYTTYERLTTARDLDEVFIPSPETPKEQEE